METGQPTTEIFFTLSLTVYKVRVYEREAEFLRKILEEARGVWLMDEHDSDMESIAQEVDTRMLAHLFHEAFPKVLEGCMEVFIPVALEAYSVEIEEE